MLPRLPDPLSMPCRSADSLSSGDFPKAPVHLRTSILGRYAREQRSRARRVPGRMTLRPTLGGRRASTSALRQQREFAVLREEVRPGLGEAVT